MLNMSGYQQKMARLRARSPDARDAAAREMMRAVMARVVSETPRDTNRLVRGYMQAANDLGLGPYALPRVANSRGAERQKKRLERQLRQVELLLAAALRSVASKERLFETRYARPGRKLDKWGRKYKADVARANTRVQRLSKVVDRAREQVANFTGAEIVIGGRKVKMGKDPGVSALAQVHNKEPHASIIERRDRIVAAAIGAMRGQGLRRAGKAYLSALGVGGAGK
jgi:hypothetical protein